MNNDEPLIFHRSFSSLLDDFRNIIAAVTWLKASINDAKRFFQPYPYVLELSCSVIDKLVKIDKSILNLVENEGFNKGTPLFSKTLINFYRIFTIAIKDIVWEESDFLNLLSRPELQFLRHLRNASAHNNLFFFGRKGTRERENNLKVFPIKWRNKEISEKLEGSDLFMNFMAPGDLFILLLDITKMTKI